MFPSETIDKVLNEIDPEELIELTAELVRINSVWDPQAGTSEEDVANHVAAWARRHGFEVQVDPVAP